MIPAHSFTPRDHQPLRWWTSAQLREIARRFEEACRGWQAAWLPRRGPELDVSAMLAWEAPCLGQQSWASLGYGTTGRAWVPPVGDARQLVTAALFQDTNTQVPGRHICGPIAAGIAAQAEDDLLAVLRDALQMDGKRQAFAPNDNVFRPWSGAVAVSASVGGVAVLRLLMDGSTAATVLSVPKAAASCEVVAKAPLSSIEEACADHRISLQVALHPCELELGALTSLQPGDILPLPHPLGTPLQVTLGDNPICGAFLGRQRTAVAVELVRGTPAPHLLDTEYNANQ
jgi:flagellar motor switch/type III secretory pathway protein FliN